MINIIFNAKNTSTFESTELFGMSVLEWTKYQKCYKLRSFICGVKLKLSIILYNITLSIFRFSLKLHFIANKDWDRDDYYEHITEEVDSYLKEYD